MKVQYHNITAWSDLHLVITCRRPCRTRVTAERLMRSRTRDVEPARWSVRRCHRCCSGVCYDGRVSGDIALNAVVLNSVDRRLDILDYCNNRRKTKHYFLCNTTSRKYNGRRYNASPRVRGITRQGGRIYIYIYIERERERERKRREWERVVTW